MNLDRLIASTGIRLMTLILSLLGVAAGVLYERDIFSEASGVLLTLAISCAVLAVIGIIYSFRALYFLWMRFAKALHAVMVILLFGVCYLFVVPLFFLISWAFDPLRLRNRSALGTFWIRRRPTPCDLTFLQRMA